MSDCMVAAATTSWFVELVADGRSMSVKRSLCALLRSEELDMFKSKSWGNFFSMVSNRCII
jgi:hypothetical protein